VILSLVAGRWSLRDGVDLAVDLRRRGQHPEAPRQKSRGLPESLGPTWPSKIFISCYEVLLYRLLETLSNLAARLNPEGRRAQRTTLPDLSS
jgi:hypothetical protein